MKATQKTLPEKIAQQIRRDILRGILKPGSPIKERDNASEMGVSRTPMREALRILAKEGLVVLRPARSPIVAEPSFKEVSDQAEVLLALEKLSAELACKNATERQLEEIVDINNYVNAYFDTIDPLDMFEVDMSFHTAIVKASNNEALLETYQNFLARLWRARYLSAKRRRNRERVVNQHTVIVEALLARDPKRVRDAIDEHLWRLAEDIRETLELEAIEQNEKD